MAERRVGELAESARILGVARLELLGYRDSGMAGTPANEDPACFWQAPVEEAAARLARILAEERADVLTVYDEHGTYGHPDHVHVHRVGVRAAELADRPGLRPKPSPPSSDGGYRLRGAAPGLRETDLLPD